MSDWQAALAIVGLAVVTVVTRGFFLFPERELRLPAWLRQGMRYAPIAALAAVIAPEVVLTRGHLLASALDARLVAVLAAGAWYAWRRNILGTIVVGTAAMVGARVGLGW